MERVGEGDLLAFYALRNFRPGLRRLVQNIASESEMKDIQAARGCFVGIGEVKGRYYEEDKYLGWVNRDGREETYPHRVKFSLSEPN